MATTDFPIQNQKAFDKVCKLSGFLLDCGLTCGATSELCKIPIGPIESLDYNFRYMSWREYDDDMWQCCGGRYWGQGYHTEAFINERATRIRVCHDDFTQTIKEFDVDSLSK